MKTISLFSINRSIATSKASETNLLKNFDARGSRRDNSRRNFFIFRCFKPIRRKETFLFLFLEEILSSLGTRIEKFLEIGSAGCSPTTWKTRRSVEIEQAAVPEDRFVGVTGCFHRIWRYWPYWSLYGLSILVEIFLNNCPSLADFNETFTLYATVHKNLNILNLS